MTTHVIRSLIYIVLFAPQVSFYVYALFNKIKSSVTPTTYAQNLEYRRDINKTDILHWFKTLFNAVEDKNIHIFTTTTLFENSKIYYDGEVHRDMSNGTNISDELNISKDTLNKNQESKDVAITTGENNSTGDATPLISIHNETLGNFVPEKTCTEDNERYSIPSSCDRYIQCENGKAEEKQCPDGLRYNSNAKGNLNPCQYSTDVTCKDGATLQTPKPTRDCPNQYGYFKIEDRFNCTEFRICEKGIGYDYKCPPGLAFNSATYRCDWPDLVPECNVELYVGFRCPQGNKLNVSQGYRSNHRHCGLYYLCTNGLPRALECDPYFGYDEFAQACVPAYLVDACSDEQKHVAMRSVRKTANGTYVVIEYIDDYDRNRSSKLSFTSKTKKRPVIIKST